MLSLLVRVGTWLSPIDPWIRRHPWLTSLLVAVVVAMTAWFASGAAAALAAIIGIIPACRFVLYMVEKGAFGPSDDYPFG